MSLSAQVKKFCSVCSGTKACVVVDVDNVKRNLCLLHFSIADKNIPTSSKKSQLKSSIIDQQEYLKQSIEVKDLWKEATADVILKMFEYEKEEQKQARLSTVPVSIPRNINALSRQENDDADSPSFPSSSSSYKQTISKEGSLDLKDSKDDMKNIPDAPSYAWRRGSLADAPVTVKGSNNNNPNTKKRTPTNSLWRTGLQKQSKKEILEEAQKILETDRNNAEGKKLLLFMVYQMLFIIRILNLKFCFSSVNIFIDLFTVAQFFYYFICFPLYFLLCS